MTEKIPYEGQAEPVWRIIIILGSTGMRGELDAITIQSLPLEAAFQEGVLGADDAVQVEPLEDTDGQYIDWMVRRADSNNALLHAVASTLQLSQFLHLEAVELKAVRMSCLDIDGAQDMRDIKPKDAWYEMIDYSDQAYDLERCLKLPETMTAEDFR